MNKMPKPPSTLAKLSCPKLFNVSPRERLFSLLDKERDKCPTIWIAGPPGSGKTVLAASYLETRKLPAIWYQMDSGDADPATFFHYLALGGRNAAGRRRIRLPSLTPEYLPDLPGFTRRFFRELFSKLRPPVVMVLDNYQQLPVESVLHEVIQRALAEFPADTNLIVISQVEPPPHFSRELVNKLIFQIGWEDLRLTQHETAALGSGIEGLDEATMEVLQEQANGWAAGIVLMLERFKETGFVNRISQSGTMTSVFNYFAGQVFDQAAIGFREFLMRTAMLPRVTGATAAEISGDPRAEQWLAVLYRRRLFTDRRNEDTLHPHYAYHALFREFLLDRSRNYFSNNELHGLKRLAADIAARTGQMGAAANLLVETKEWGKLNQYICAHSASLLAQGRHQTVQELVARLPRAEVQKAPWLLYWRGVSLMVFDPLAANTDLRNAYDQFKMKDDTVGLFLSCVAVMDAYFFAEDDMTPVIEWGERLHQLIIRSQGFPSLEIKARVLGSMQGLMYAAPHHPLVMELEESVENFLESFGDPLGRIAIAFNFLMLAMWRGDFRRARRIIDELNSQLGDSTMPPLQLVMWRFLEGNYAWSTSSHEIAVKKFQEALSHTQTFGMPLLNTMLYGMHVYSALSEGDIVQAERCLSKAEAANHFQRRHALGQFSFLRAGISLLKGDTSSALHHASTALMKIEPLGRPFLLANCRLGLARILIECGDTKGARSYTRKVRDYARTMKSQMLEQQSLLVEAYSFHKEGKYSQARLPLKEGLRIAAANDYLNLDDWWRLHTIGVLLAFALEMGVERDYVQSVIRRRHIKPPSGTIEMWPWSIKVYTLGRFEVLLDNQPLPFSGKPQFKPLQLLQYLCAFGGGPIHQDRLTDALWPDAEGDASAQALRTTLHRLRKLLEHEDAVRMKDHQMSLDPTYVWVDSLSFERTVQKLDITNMAALQRGIDFYHGNFLPGENTAWALPIRERLRAQYMGLIERLGVMLEEKGDLSGAVQYYLKAFEVEPVAEIFCRRLMSLYGRLGRRTEALAVYQRFSHALRTSLGINPTSETVRLYQQIANC